MQIGLPGLTFLIFLTLKLTNYIDWSWWLVTSPLWIGFGFCLVFFIFALFMAVMSKR